MGSIVNQLVEFMMWVSLSRGQIIVAETHFWLLKISNKARLGLTEYQAVRQMYDGVKKLIELEKAEL